MKTNLGDNKTQNYNLLTTCKFEISLLGTDIDLKPSPNVSVFPGCRGGGCQKHWLSFQPDLSVLTLRFDTKICRIFSTIQHFV